MGVFLAILMIMTTGAVAVFLVVKMREPQYALKDKSKIALINLVAVSVTIFCNIISGRTGLILRLPFDLVISIFAMLVLTSSLLEDQTAIKVARGLLILVCLLAVFYLLKTFGLFQNLYSEHFILLTGLVSIMICSFYLLSIGIRMREIRSIMQNANVWASICLNVDFIYLVILFLYVFALFVSTRISVNCTYVTAGIVSLLMVCELAALGLRIAMDSLFILWRKHENLIVESMKISHTDVAQDTSGISEMYKDIYTRLVNLFETDKPYLNSELTINDIVKVIFTNKLYISRAISKFTGRNFCQFVNYYRVLYSIQLFRDNPNLKVIEMATRSGFNSTVTFTMAFRLYMSECPSDWCRKEKLKLGRRKK